MSNYSTPGVYVEEIASLPPIIAPVGTAIPAFIGYTEKGAGTATEPVVSRISSMVEYQDIFGGPFNEPFKGEVKKEGEVYQITKLPDAPKTPKYALYYQLQMFYANGGGPCYIVSVGNYSNAVSKTNLEAGIEALKKEDEPTLIVIPDALGIANKVDDFYALYKTALAQCAELKDRFTIIDLIAGEKLATAAEFREKIGANHLSYGAAYFPWVLTTLQYAYNEAEVELAVQGGQTTLKLKASATPDASLFHLGNDTYNRIIAALSGFQMKLPPSGAIAGIYAQVDNSRGVSKAPANVSLNKVIQPTLKLSNQDQDGLNAPPSGKAINAIRTFSDKGVLVWGARTLDANSSEWRYIPVRRFFNFAEESIGKTIDRFVFEPNNESTWISVRASIENFLTDQWRAGALVGRTTQQAFFVQVGLGKTMTAQDILSGKLIVVVGMAVVRPAEFIILRFTHKLQEA